jgi:hypothetical protein
MPKSGQARVLSQEQQNHLFNVIQQHRHPEKNTAIMQISFKLALRAQDGAADDADGSTMALATGGL